MFSSAHYSMSSLFGKSLLEIVGRMCLEVCETIWGVVSGKGRRGARASNGTHVESTCTFRGTAYAGKIGGIGPHRSPIGEVLTR